MTQRGGDELIAGLAAQIRERRAVLFVGAGVSSGLGLPEWRTLIEWLGEDLGVDGERFVEQGADFRSLTEFYRLERGSIEPLVEWMRREWRVPEERLRRSAAHRLIVALDFPTIYTTNYDHLLEQAFRLHGRRVNTVITTEDLARAAPGLPTIVKFHGDLDVPESLVVTETDYFKRLAFEEPLDIRLTADAFARSVLFIGYSLSDVNLRLMLFRMRGIWLDSGYERSQPRSFVFMARPNRIEQRVLGSWGIAPLLGDRNDESEALVAFLERLYAAVGPAPRAS